MALNKTSALNDYENSDCRNRLLCITPQPSSLRNNPKVWDWVCKPNYF